MAAILQKYYVYDPGLHVGDELGRLRVLEDDKGKHIMAVPEQIQYWMDQGLAGVKPLGELSDSAKKFLDQITRGRSIDNEQPQKLPKYDKQIQSGTPGTALKQPLSTERRNKMIREKEKSKKTAASNHKKAEATRKEPPKAPTPAAPANPPSTTFNKP